MTKTRLTFMGSGTSQGVPVIGCNCPVCKSTDPKDKRFRSSVLVEHEGMTILVDAGPDFRSQMLREGITHLDAILLTHNHKDHTGGLDDVRALNYTEGRACDIYCEKYVEDSLRQEYAYAFSEHKYPGVPEWHIHNIENKTFEVTVDDNAPRLQDSPSRRSASSQHTNYSHKGFPRCTSGLGFPFRGHSLLHRYELYPGRGIQQARRPGAFHYQYGKEGHTQLALGT